MMSSRVEAIYRPEHGKVSVLLNTPDDVDVLVNSLLGGSVDQNMAELYSLERPRLPSGFPDHGLVMGVDRVLQVGILASMDACGNWATLGSHEGRTEVYYFMTGHATEFPAYSDIPIDFVRRGGQGVSSYWWTETYLRSVAGSLICPETIELNGGPTPSCGLPWKLRCRGSVHG